MSDSTVTKPAEVGVTEVRRIAELARLSPSPAEEVKLASDMSHILGYVEQLNELDVEGVEPLHHVLDLHNVLRTDEPKPSFTVEQALANAPARKGDYFIVPKVIKEAE